MKLSPCHRWPRMRPRYIGRPGPLPVRRPRRHRGGFTLIEALIATALLGFSLVVMFGFHSQAVRSNRDARRMTACTYLAQAQVERLMSLPWDASSRHTDLTDSMTDPTTASDPWAFLEMPSGGAEPAPVKW
ncbi:MAG: prepilin-type N-terminal cleavage/methylation domain-containing protein [Myxococcota bacterium]|nr:prepilin-type N-terminal cleavage/methylation domain-containing protein [Myxococcota bacterium]